MMSLVPKRQKLFDKWAQTYDLDVHGKNIFPFLGYGDVIRKMITLSEIQDHHTILDLGIGTANLARKLPIPEGQIWGVDFSAAMLEKAHTALPDAHLIQADLAGERWLHELAQPFDRILSAYTLHEFPDLQKNALILRLAKAHLKPDGWIVIGDISFETKAQFDWAQEYFAELWDEEEHYWCAEPVTGALNKAGFSVKYHQVSICAGIYRICLGNGLTQSQ